jgi:hypothetical protein
VIGNPKDKEGVIRNALGWEKLGSTSEKCWCCQGGICDQKTSKFCVPQGRIHDRTHGYKWSLLKVREGKYKREHGGNLEAEEESASLLQVLLKLTNLEEERNQVIPIQ